jgi:hypothetical protein
LDHRYLFGGLCEAHHTGRPLLAVAVGDGSKEGIPMQTSYVASTHISPVYVSRDLAAVILFCLLGLTISAAWISYLGADAIGLILAHLE